MTFVVDCLNHTAQEELDYRTALEKMYEEHARHIRVPIRFLGTNQLQNILQQTFYKADSLRDRMGLW